MLTCSKCQKENADAAKFCTGCGNQLTQLMPPPVVIRDDPPAAIECPRCMNKNKTTAKFCVVCGTSLLPEQIVPEIEEPLAIEEEESKKKTILSKPAFWIVSGLLAAAAIAGYFFFLPANNTKEPQKESPVVLNASVDPAPDTMVAQDVAPDTLAKEQNTDTIAKVNDPIPKEVISLPTAPSRQHVINDLAGLTICNGISLSKDFTISFFKITKRTATTCTAVISFMSPGNKTRYTVTAAYTNDDGKFVYAGNTCNYKEEPAQPKQQVSVPEYKHNVQGDLINYFKDRRSFGGIQYNDVKDITILRIASPQYFENTGNTAYSVELSVNGIARICQVIYTANGKVHFNAIK